MGGLIVFFIILWAASLSGLGYGMKKGEGEYGFENYEHWFSLRVTCMIVFTASVIVFAMIPREVLF